MDKRSEKTAKNNKPDSQLPHDEGFEYSSTAKIPRDKFIGEITIKHRAYLEIIDFGEKNRIFELEEGEIIIGRGPECGIQLSIDNVSRKHARLIFDNEEYHIEDLGSSNGTYVNGIEVVKCSLRSNDQIDIGGVKILFTEEKKLQKI